MTSRTLLEMATRSGGDGRTRLPSAVATALAAFAAGDAFGVAYEFTSEAGAVTTERISPRAGWPFGGVSDDTLLSLLTVEAIVPGHPEESAQKFLTSLRRAVPRLRGLGPTTRAALGLPVSGDEEHWVGVSNGGMMRTALVGLAYAATAGHERREMTAALARATHSGDTAVACAVLAAGLFSDALEDSPVGSEGVLRIEAPAMASTLPCSAEVVESVLSWKPARDGVSLRPEDTLGAVVYVADRARTCLEAYQESCDLGGDTDTVSALAAGLVAAREAERCGLGDIRWLHDVRWDEIPNAGEAAHTLASLRDRSGTR